MYKWSVAGGYVPDILETFDNDYGYYQASAYGARSFNPGFIVHKTAYMVFIHKAFECSN